MFTSSNAVLVALVQTGVIVIGILAAGVSHKFWMDAGISLSPATSFFHNFGTLLLLVPLIWISMAMSVQQSRVVSPDTKDIAFWSGTVLILGLFAFELYAIFNPWFRICTMVGFAGEIE